MATALRVQADAWGNGFIQLANGWVKIEMGAFPDGKPEKRAFRSYRHSFNDELKNSGVSLEMRRELMGHRRHLRASAILERQL